MSINIRAALPTLASSQFTPPTPIYSPVSTSSTANTNSNSTTPFTPEYRPDPGYGYIAVAICLFLFLIVILMGIKAELKKRRANNAADVQGGEDMENGVVGEGGVRDVERGKPTEDVIGSSRMQGEVKAATRNEEGGSSDNDNEGEGGEAFELSPYIRGLKETRRYQGRIEDEYHQYLHKRDKHFRSSMDRFAKDDPEDRKDVLVGFSNDEGMGGLEEGGV